MPRKSFLEILKSADVNIGAEYRAVHSLFYDLHPEICYTSLYSFVDENFIHMPIHGTCLTLSEFDDRHGFCVRSVSNSDDLDDLILLMEYILNIVSQIPQIPDAIFSMEDSAYRFIAEHINAVCEKINYKALKKEEGYILVERNPAAIEAAQVLSDESSYLPLEYSHHSLKGDLQGKRNILLNLSNELEPKREELRKIDKGLENDLFFCLNNLNIRHNNVSKSSSKYREYVANMSKPVLEKWYDYTYEMILVALIKLGTYPDAEDLKNLKENLA